MKNEDTLESLEKEAAIIAEKRKVLLEKTRDAELVKAKGIIRTYGFTAAYLEISIVEVKPTKTTRKARVAKDTTTAIVVKTPKYADLTNPDKTWAGGQGPRPKWVKAHLDKGGHLEDLLIKK